MKRFGICAFCGLLLVSCMARAGGPYEVGKMNIDGNTCVWTSYIEQDCTREEMQKNVKAMQDCLDPQFDAGMEDCPSEECVRERIRQIASDCCYQAGGEME